MNGRAELCAREGWKSRGSTRRFNAAAGVPFVATLSQSQSQSPESASQAKPAHLRPNLRSRRARESQIAALRSLSARARYPSLFDSEPGTDPSWLTSSTSLLDRWTHAFERSKRMKPYWRTVLSYSVFQSDRSVPWVAEALAVLGHFLANRN